MVFPIGRLWITFDYSLYFRLRLQLIVVGGIKNLSQRQLDSNETQGITSYLQLSAIFLYFIILCRLSDNKCLTELFLQKCANLLRIVNISVRYDRTDYEHLNRLIDISDGSYYP